MVTIPTRDEIKEQIMADLEAADTSVPLGFTSIMEIIATAFSGVLYLGYKFGAWAYNQIFTASMGYESLKKRGTRYGLTPTAATECKATASARGTDGTVIAAGKICEINGNAYSVDAAVSIDGESTVNITSLEKGADVQLTAGDVLSWSTPQTGLDESVTVTDVTKAATDAESKSSFRTRVQTREQQKPQGGALPDYVNWALEVSGVSEAYAFRPQAGYVNVYVIADAEERIPTTALRGQVETYLNDTSRKPFARDASVPEWRELSFRIDVSAISPDDQSVLDAVESAIDDYLISRRPKQYPDQLIDKSNITAAEISKVAVGAGAVNFVFTITLDSSDITDEGYELEEDELATGVITWPT